MALFSIIKTAPTGSVLGYQLHTFHSSRGLEGNRIVIFGIEHLRGLSKQIGVDLGKLGYVVLSRSLFETVIAVRRSTHSDIVTFIETALGTVRGVP